MELERYTLDWAREQREAHRGLIGQALTDEGQHIGRISDILVCPVHAFDESRKKYLQSRTAVIQERDKEAIYGLYLVVEVRHESLTNPYFLFKPLAAPGEPVEQFDIK